MVEGGITRLQYADDTIIMLEGDLESIKNVKFLLYCFESKCSKLQGGPATNDVSRLPNKRQAPRGLRFQAHDGQNEKEAPALERKEPIFRGEV